MLDFKTDPVYKQKTTINEFHLPPFPYLCIRGKGNPNTPDFSARIQSLFSMAYTIKMSPKKGWMIPNYDAYKVYPLEGIWDLTEQGRKDKTLDKNELIYTLMIRQPNFVTIEVFNEAKEIIRKKGNVPLVDEVFFERVEDGHCAQVLHVGSFDEETRSFERLKANLKERGFERRSLTHREIYLSDFRKTNPEKLKTILRYFLK